MNGKLFLVAVGFSSVVSFSASAQNIADSVSLTTEQPDAKYCQYQGDLGKLSFDPESGRLWACGNEGWVYFESQSNSQYQCLNEQASDNQYPEWKPRPWNVKNGQYYQGEVVRHKGKLYTPSNSAVYGGAAPSKATWDWQVYLEDNQLPKLWEPSHVYQIGDRVVHMGIEYVATSSNSNKLPNDETANYQPWDFVGPFSCPAEN